MNYLGFVTRFRFMYLSSVSEDFHCCCGFYIGLVLVVFYLSCVNQEHEFGLGKEEGLEAL